MRRDEKGYNYNSPKDVIRSSISVVQVPNIILPGKVHETNSTPINKYLVNFRSK